MITATWTHVTLFINNRKRCPIQKNGSQDKSKRLFYLLRFVSLSLSLPLSSNLSTYYRLYLSWLKKKRKKKKQKYEREKIYYRRRVEEERKPNLKLGMLRWKIFQFGNKFVSFFWRGGGEADIKSLLILPGFLLFFFVFVFGGDIPPSLFSFSTNSLSLSLRLEKISTNWD